MEIEVVDTIIGVIGAIIAGVVVAIITRILAKPGVSTKTGRIGAVIENLFRRSTRLVTSRRKIKSEKFYEPYYRDAESVYISGIALTGFIKYICKAKGNNPSLPNTHLLQMMKERYIVVKALLMNPNSEFVEKRKLSENNPAIQKDICQNIQSLKELEIHLKHLPPGFREIQGRLEISICDQDLLFTTFHAVPTKTRNPATIYLGLLFPNVRGDESPLIYVRNIGPQQRLYENCSNYFHSLYTKAKLIFQWNSRDVQWYGDPILDACKKILDRQ